MRVFFALQPDARTITGIADWRDRQFSQAGRAVSAANLHMTLAFVGELEQRSLEGLCQAVDDWCERAAPQGGSLLLDQAGYWHRPGIYWLGPSTWPESLQLLADGLRTIASRAGGKREQKRFQPHITLFRGCKTAPPAPAAFPDKRFDYKEFSLFESRQGKNAVSYHALCHWRLESH